MGSEYQWYFTHAVAKVQLQTALLNPTQIDEGGWKSLHGAGLIGLGQSGWGRGSWSRRTARESTFQSFHASLENADKDDAFRDYLLSILPLSIAKVAVDHSVRHYVCPFAAAAYDAVISTGIAACRAKTTNENKLFTGHEMMQQLLTKSQDDPMFIGASGPITIDESTGTRFVTTTEYAMYNILLERSNTSSGDRWTFRTIQTSEYCSNTEHHRHHNDSAMSSWHTALDAPSFIYANNSTDPPPSLPSLILHREQIHATSLTLVSIIASFQVLAAVGFGVWTIWNRNDHVVKSSQPEFLLGLVLGVILMTVSAVMNGFEDSFVPKQLASISCMSTFWLGSSGFCLIFAMLAAKMSRINRMLQSTQNFSRREVVRCSDVIGPSAFLVFTCLALLAFWQIVDPLEQISVYSDSVDEFGRPNRYVTWCRQSSGQKSVLFPVLILLVGMVAMVYANVQAYRARSLQTEFSESVYIGLIFAVFLQDVIFGFPAILADVGKDLNFWLVAIYLLIASGSTLYLIFVPKVIFWRERRYRAARGLRSESRVEISFATGHSMFQSPSMNSSIVSSFDSQAHRGILVARNPKRYTQRRRISGLSNDPESSSAFQNFSSLPGVLQQGGPTTLFARTTSWRPTAESNQMEEIDESNSDDDPISTSVGLPAAGSSSPLPSSSVGHGLSTAPQQRQHHRRSRSLDDQITDGAMNRCPHCQRRRNSQF